MSSFDNSKIAQAKTDSEMLLEDPKSLKKKKKADKKRRRKYKFTDKHHPKNGIISTFLAVVSIALVVLAIMLATSTWGSSGAIVGVLPVIALLVSTGGIVLALSTFRRTDAIYTFSWIGLVCHILVWLFVAVMLAIGL